LLASLSPPASSSGSSSSSVRPLTSSRLKNLTAQRYPARLRGLDSHVPNVIQLYDLRLNVRSCCRSGGRMNRRRQTSPHRLTRY
jgi:hypothetical protein